MNTKSLMWLGVITLIVAAIAAFALRSREAAVKGAAENQQLFPDLVRSVNDVATITVKKKDGESTLQKSGDGWILVEKKGYPVDLEPVRKTLIGLTEATVVEEKTSEKERYSKLGVQEPDAEGSTSTLVTLKDASGKVLASLIVGKAHEGKSFGSNQVYVRKTGQAQSWLAKAALDLKDKNVDWLDKKILEIKRDRIRSVEVKHPDGEIVHAERAKPEDTNFTLAAIPEGKELTFPTAPSGMASALEWLNLEDVVPAAEVDFKTGTGPVCTFKTFDGMTIVVTTKDDKDKTYARFEIAYEAPADAAAPADASKPEDKKDDKKPEKKTPEEVKKEVADLNARLSPWVYVIPTYNKASFTKHMADLVKDKAPPPPPPGSEPATNPAGETGKPGDPETYKIPSDLPPEIQKQIEEHQASLGHKTTVVPAKPVDPKPDDKKPDEKKPEENKSSETKPQDEKPKDTAKPPRL